jgi:hypothetical protein
MLNARGNLLVAIYIAIFTSRDYGVNGALNVYLAEAEEL